VTDDELRRLAGMWRLLSAAQAVVEDQTRGPRSNCTDWLLDEHEIAMTPAWNALFWRLRALEIPK
jgi:hypothetical protein